MTLFYSLQSQLAEAIVDPDADYDNADNNDEEPEFMGPDKMRTHCRHVYGNGEQLRADFCCRDY